MKKARQHTRVSLNATLVAQADRQRRKGDIRLGANDGQQPRSFRLGFFEGRWPPCQRSTDLRRFLRAEPI
ncbi:MAG: hypothetical protein ABF876_07210 [Acetobacter aceti]|uniref:Uncharacterized protein n=1 Tax=Acetobacter aceti TaxID=435 RepID=A0A1U9KD75_ACEAC|nr:hypothetical protein [Acetobacter aceti]AQS83764.1 hypothetical protein A0U92_02115 [Acetobacter aceti]